MQLWRMNVKHRSVKNELGTTQDASVSSRGLETLLKLSFVTEPDDVIVQISVTITK